MNFVWRQLGQCVFRALTPVGALFIIYKEGVKSMRNVNIGKSIIYWGLLLISICCIVSCSESQEKEPRTTVTYCELKYDNDVVNIIEMGKGSAPYRAEYSYNEDGNIAYANLYKKYTNILEYKLEYDANENISKYTDYTGTIAKNIRIYEYDDKNELIKCSFYDIDTLKYYVTYEYDKGYLSKRSTYANGILDTYISYTYDTNGNILTKITYSISEDNVTYNETAKTVIEYDAQSRITVQTEFNGERMTKKDEYDYSSENTKRTSYTSYNPEGVLELSCIYESNDKDLLVFQDFPTGGSHTYNYNDSGTLINEVNRFNNSVVCLEREYNEIDNLTKATFNIDEKPGFTIEYTYDENDIVTASEILNANGEVIYKQDTYILLSWSYSTDSSKNLHNMQYYVEHINDNGNTSIYYYRAETGTLAKHQETCIDSEGNIIESMTELYNENGILTERTERSPDGNYITQSYSEEGTITAITERFLDGHEISKYYTDGDILWYTIETYIDGSSTYQFYNNEGKITSKTDYLLNGEKISYEYNYYPDGKLYEIIENYPDGKITSRQYSYSTSSYFINVTETDPITLNRKSSIYLEENTLAFYIIYKASSPSSIKVYDNEDKIVYETSDGRVSNRWWCELDSAVCYQYLFDNVSGKEIVISYNNGHLTIS